VQMEVYAVDGRLLKTLTENGIQSGRYYFDFDRDVAGVYLVKIAAGGYSISKRIIVVK
jgi:hypothetical protein